VDSDLTKYEGHTLLNPGNRLKLDMASKDGVVATGSN
jgi:hypothetical protein